MSDEVRHKFSDVIGALVASVAHARSVADIESLRIAYRYRNNELLKGMPIPRLRFRRVSISLPVVLTDLIPGTPAEISPDYVIEDAVENAFKADIAQLLETLERAANQTDLSDDERRRLQRYQRLASYVQRPEVDVPQRLRQAFGKTLQAALADLRALPGGDAPSDAAIQGAVGEAAALAFKNVFDEVTYLYIQDRVMQQEQRTDFDPERARRDRSALNEDEILVDLKNRIRQSAEAAAIRKATVPPDFVVSVNTDVVKNAGGGPDAVTRLSMVLSEEGLEWVTEYGPDGAETTRLIPE